MGANIMTNKDQYVRNLVFVQSMKEKYQAKVQGSGPWAAS